MINYKDIKNISKEEIAFLEMASSIAYNIQNRIFDGSKIKPNIDLTLLKTFQIIFNDVKNRSSDHENINRINFILERIENIYSVLQDRQIFQ